MAESIKEFGFKVPLVIDKNGIIVTGHTRYKAAQTLGMAKIPCIVSEDLTEEQIKAFRLIDNKTSEYSTWDLSKLEIEVEELQQLEFDMSDYGFELLEKKIQEDNFDIEDHQDQEEENSEPTTKLGDIYQLGDHRLMCGDSTKAEQVTELMNGKIANLCFTDPPYGMKKEKDGVTNDNLNFDDLLEFNKKWIALTFKHITENGSWYCWGIDEPLMDIYSDIVKPMIREGQATFRNLITWDKGSGQGQTAKDYRMYPIADEKCLFVVKGVVGFNTNSEHYFEGWEPIRKYLFDQRELCGWDIPTMKDIAGHSDRSRDHWTSKSQWTLITKKVYETFKAWAVDNNIKAWARSYADLKKEYEEIKKNYYDRMAYFNNTHDNMNNVWHFKRTAGEEREAAGGHATPKPLELCARAMKSSSRKGDLIIDLFGGSGSTIMAAEGLGRVCYTMELERHWCDVIIKRYEDLTGLKAEKVN